MKNKSLIKKLGVTFGIYFILILLCIFKFNNYHIMNLDNVLINILLAVSLSITVGFLGQLALGHAGFMVIGAYTSAIITTYLKLPSFLLFPISILASGIFAGFFGLIIGIPALRLKGDYLAIITLGFGEIIKNIIQNLDITKGAKGYKGILKYSTNPNVNKYINFTVIFFVTAFTIIFIQNLIKSRHGRAIIAIREDEIAAEASGINTAYYKILAYVATAFFAGIAGAIYAHHIGILEPGKFDYNYSIEMVIMVVLGGMGNITGTIFSAIFLTLLPQFLSSLEKYRMLIYSLLLIVTILIKQKNPNLFNFNNIKNKIKNIFNKKKESAK